MHRDCAGQSRCVFPLDLSWEDVRPGAAALCFSVRGSLSKDVPHVDGEHSWETEGNIALVAALEAWWRWGRKWSYPQILQLLTLSHPFCLFNLVSVFLQPMRSRVTWEMSFLSPCAWLIGAGVDGYRRRQAFAMATVLPTIRFGSSRASERLWVSQSEHHIWGAHVTASPPVPVTEVLTESTNSKPVCFLQIYSISINNVLLHSYGNKIPMTFFLLL